MDEAEESDEVAGSIEAFLPLYLTKIAEVGYERASNELDAREWV